MTVHDNANRVIRQATDAAQAIDPDARPRFTITAVTVNKVAGDRAVPVADTFEAVTTEQAYTIVRAQTDAADRTDQAITFTITPVFPTYWTDFADIVVEKNP